MEDVRRIRPEGKRKAHRAVFFRDRYDHAAYEAFARGDEEEGQRFLSKMLYWRQRVEALAHHL